MWIITVFNTNSKGNKITMFEFDTEKEAKENYVRIQGCKILSEIKYYQAPSFSLS
ncbi:hypothetical protein J7E79_25990 [Bacillus sp. ISL-40]|uniref:hypothetical protein n=1 Tax=unclassified Bacillus (in: firmicutes) TaxID=185979 RepID=UPI001BED1816|nr:MULTISPECIES: hypothetical protein [unclassified Bacillus (in: firmicutes)]MBT2700785.1 hypothetical protein [Bacillus sp. ISL-40]MBT2742691.1 hypothetical protein [Bacillus sp. ISL-77]